MKELYIYETHMHTLHGSACSVISGRDIARIYKEHGYTGIIITDHFVYGNTAVDRSLPWNEWVENYCKGYEEAKAEGDKIGLQVFFGWESGYGGPEFLVYGLDKAWLLAHPEIRDCDVKTQYKLVHEAGGIVIQAHPFREAGYIEGIHLFPKSVDGIEGYNGSHSARHFKDDVHPEYNDRAVTYANWFNFPMTAGSDQHSERMIYGGMVFDRKLEDIHDFAKAVLNREAVKLLDGNDLSYFKTGEGC